MNISQPVAAAIAAVRFGFLSSDDISRLSVKRITNHNTFDELLHPIPGGLHDTALGAFGDNPCATCHLDIHSCPGHAGHIELPVHVFHVTFIEQLWRYVRARCVFCSRFRLARIAIHRYACKLRLLRYGLLAEAEGVEDVGQQADIDESKLDAEEIMEKRDEYAKKCIRRAGGFKRGFDFGAAKSEAVMTARRDLLTHFQTELTRSRECVSCKGISPTYRKVGAHIFWEKALNDKDRGKNAQNHKRVPETALQANLRAQKERSRILQKKRHSDAMEIDEGVADMDSTPEEELIDPMIGEEADDVSDVQEQGGDNLVQTEAGLVGTKRTTKQERGQKYLSGDEVHAQMVQLFEREREILSLIYPGSARPGQNVAPSPDMFFVKSLLVPPNKYRKEQMAGNQVNESQDNQAYIDVMKRVESFNDCYRNVQGFVDLTVTRQKTIADLYRTWQDLQIAVNTLIDSEKSGLKGPAALRVPMGIKQRLEKKEGLFRMNIMGKRVNFAARSVISPDPNIETTEIGVPPVFARKLTYPEPVTSHNYDELNQAVKNGPNKWPGAVAIEDETGRVTLLARKSDEERQALANTLLAPSSTTTTGTRNKKVHRHLNNGDIVIMNRQPTLHKPSMMCHRAKVLPGEKTIRMHYANCNSYNADFDGDEMNMHFPQNEIARAEALQIADTDHQYLSATAGQPLRGLIQDHLSMGVWLTNQDTFFTREEYYQLIYAGIRPEHSHTPNANVLTLEPDILKPKQRWTGKQVVSTILLNIKPNGYGNIYLDSKSQTPSDRWGPYSDDGVVRVRDGLLVTGILDKKQIGPASGGLVHTIYEAYGHTIAGKFLSILGRLLTKLEHMRAFSCGVEDLVMTAEGEQNRREELKGASTIGLGVVADYVTLADQKPKADDKELLTRLERVLRNEGQQAVLDTVMNGRTAGLSSAITKACLPDGLIKHFPKNNMQAMTTSGAKGSQVNANLISCNLGQQVLEGRRVPVMVSGKTLPCFKPFESSIRAGGYIVDRFLTGVRPQEYFFHAMAGREGLIDTAVKTSRSGYLQRVLIKGLEGLRAEYDTTVRDSDGTIIQTLYGEDGLDICKSQSVYDFKFISRNYMSLFNSLGVRGEIEHTFSTAAIEHTKKSVKAYLRSGEKLGASDPTLSVYPPLTNTGSTSEKFHFAVQHYFKNDPDNSIRPKGSKANDLAPKRVLNEILQVNYMKAVVTPGEAVGVVAGQSIGEPSTQMTLNTFHLAGHAAKNVTLGIPRLREILMTASKKLSTPTMSLYPLEELKEGDAAKFAKGITKLSLAEVIDNISVEERIGSGIYPDSRIYDVHLKLFPSEEYVQEYAITKRDLAVKLEKSFLNILQRLLRAEFKKRGDEKSLTKDTDAMPAIGKARALDVTEGDVGKAAPHRVGKEKEAAEEAEEEVTAAGKEGGNDDGDSDDDDDAEDPKKLTVGNEADADEEDEAALNNAGVTADKDGEDDDDDVDANGEQVPQTEAELADAKFREKQQKKADTEAETAEELRISQAAEEREERVKAKYVDLTAFTFDDKTGEDCHFTFQYNANNAKILFLPLVEEAARKCLIHNVPGVESAVMSKDDTQKKDIVFMQGINLRHAWEWQDIIIPSKIFTNDIWQMHEVYGVEACRMTIIRELKNVFESHSIKVDIRHLTLVADYMTRGGGYAAFSRMGMRDKRSAFAKMSFETTTGFLKEAVFDGEIEDLESPSARITIGKVGRMGTGMFGVMMPVA